MWLFHEVATVFTHICIVEIWDFTYFSFFDNFPVKIPHKFFAILAYLFERDLCRERIRFVYILRPIRQAKYYHFMTCGSLAYLRYHPVTKICDKVDPPIFIPIWICPLFLYSLEHHATAGNQQILPGSAIILLSRMQHTDSLICLSLRINLNFNPGALRCFY